jgi:hypothetical protein
MNSFASIAAAVAAAAANASAGITSPILSPSLKLNSSSSNNKKQMCNHHSHFNVGVCSSPKIISNASTNNNIIINSNESNHNNNINIKNGLTLNTHQIGTNLSELSVCWHKMSSSDDCEKCGEPFYEGNYDKLIKFSIIINF